MIHKFDEHPTRADRALQIWLILIGKAANRQTITYGMIADLLGYAGAGTLAGMLAPVMYYCRDSSLPPLTCIVVNQDTGLPGDGIGIDPAELNRVRESVYRYAWYGLVPPTVAELNAAG